MLTLGDYPFSRALHDKVLLLWCWLTVKLMMMRTSKQNRWSQLIWLIVRKYESRSLYTKTLILNSSKSDSSFFVFLTIWQAQVSGVYGSMDQIIRSDADCLLLTNPLVRGSLPGILIKYSINIQLVAIWFVLPNQNNLSPDLY